MLGLNIKGKTTVQQSLAEHFQGELMAGENAVFCDKCNKKSSLRITPSVARLPKLLILHLKRFELDYSTFTTRKVNDKIAFPSILDMRPYTRPAADPSEAAASPDGAVEESKADAAPSESEHRELYELAGVLVHVGALAPCFGPCRFGKSVTLSVHGSLQVRLRVGTTTPSSKTASQSGGSSLTTTT